MLDLAAYESPNWQPLELAVELHGLPKHTCAGWMWMSHGKDGSESYKHSASRRYIWVASNGVVYHATGLLMRASKVKRALQNGEVQGA